MLKHTLLFYFSLFSFMTSLFITIVTINVNVNLNNNNNNNNDNNNNGNNNNMNMNMNGRSFNDDTVEDLIRYIATALSIIQVNFIKSYISGILENPPV